MSRKRKYSIILVNHGKRQKTLSSWETEEKAYKKFNALIEENKEVVFPIQYNNLKHVMTESMYEIVLIKERQDGDAKVNKIRDSYGKFTNYETNDEEWMVVDRAEYFVEETFWVYGYHPKLQRKTFMWIYDNIISSDAKDKYKFKSVVLYNNKILVECDGKLDMIICKNKKDAIRFYNLVEKKCTNDKLKYIFFIGSISKSKHKVKWIDKIQKLTHWKRDKIHRITTRP